ncbi:hypothetical protein DL96DRAFT_1579400, partial [Flagelloscypha sp. PMI_526]
MVRNLSTFILLVRTFCRSNPQLYHTVTLDKPTSYLKLYEELQNPDSRVASHLHYHTRVLEFSLSPLHSLKDPLNFARYGKAIISACSNITSFEYWAKIFYSPRMDPATEHLEDNVREVDVSSVAELLLTRSLQQIRMRGDDRLFQRIASLAPSMATQLMHLGILQISLEEIKRFPSITHAILYSEQSEWAVNILTAPVARIIEYLVSLKRLVVCIFIVNDESHEAQMYKRLKKLGISTSKVYVLCPEPVQKGSGIIYLVKLKGLYSLDRRN